MRSAPRHGRRRGPASVRPGGRLPPGLHYDRGFVGPEDRREIVDWLATIHPIWERRYAAHHPPPAGRQQRWLLRPVYWLGNWQFACLDYYHPPKGVLSRCVRAEPYPPVLRRLIAEAERIAHRIYGGADMPPGWHLNTCLVNFYGSRIEGGRRIDTARVGEHKDFEPGPVASISLGARAFFQFVTGSRTPAGAAVAFQQWLDDGSLQIFGGDRWKRQLFHRVQRVDRKGETFAVDTEQFVTRRVNFTFRYVPDEHIVPFEELPALAADDVREYVERLARHSPFFRRALAARDARATPRELERP